MQQVQGNYLISIPIKREIILTGNSDNQEMNLTAMDNSFSCVMLNSVDPANIAIPKQNKVYLKRAKIISSLPGLLPGIVTNTENNFTAIIYPLGRNINEAAPYYTYFGRLCFNKFDEWMDFNAELICKDDKIEDYWIPGIGNQSMINYQDSNLNSFWVGKKGCLKLIAEIQTPGVLDTRHWRLV